MDISKYKEKKEKNLVQIIALGDSFALVSKRFDPDTGLAVNDQIITIDKQALETQKNNLQGQVDQINELLADLDAVTQQS